MKCVFEIKQLSLAVLATGTLIVSPTMTSMAQDHAHHASAAVAHEHAAVSQSAILSTYAEQAYQYYAASLADAKLLQKQLQEFAANPTEDNLLKSKQAWIQSRESYGLTEAFRLSNGPIDAEDNWVSETYGALESQINAWPLDEFMIDYIVDADGKRTTGNIIDSTGEFLPKGDGAKAIDVTNLNAEVLTELNENGGEANVTTGYHAIEFLLWGQDQDYSNFIEDKVTPGAMTAGQRPLSDFTEDKFAARRLAYLNASADKLVQDLQTVTGAWAPKLSGTEGLYRAAFLGQLVGDQADKNIDATQALRQVIAGMGVFMKSELANERVAVAVLTPSEEDEHSCFSDNTHRDIVQNFEGFVEILKGQVNGKKIGPSLYDALGKSEQEQLDKQIAAIQERMYKMDALAKSTMHFDHQIMPQNEAESRNIIAMKNAMRKLGDQMIVVAKAVGIELNEDDVTDAEETQV